MEIGQNKKESLKKLLKSKGYLLSSQIVGDIGIILKYGYDNNIVEFAKDADIKLVQITGSDKPSMYIDDLVVKNLPLDDVQGFSKKELNLGTFTFGPRNGTKFKFNGRLTKVKTMYGDKWRVVGMSGSYGFGYSFINTKETLGKTYRKQIFQQIIDKYKLDGYIN